MTRNLRILAISAILVLLSVSTFAQNNPTWRTDSGALVGEVVDIDNGHGRLQVESDDARRTRMTVETDSIATQFFGFGSIISGKPEIFTGSKGFSNVRLGDRVEVRGSSLAGGILKASSITLLGRQVAANPTGVGQTRTQTSVATAAQQRETTTTTTAGTVEGTIRQINANEGRIVIQNAARRMMTVRTYRNTPVIYRNQTYEVSNLEIGDEIRVIVDPNDAQFDEVSARRIEVIRSIQDSDTNRTGGVVTVLEGAVTRTEPGLDYAYVNDGRGEVRVDMSKAEDANGARVHARDVRAGDRVEITGSFNRVGDMFLASTVRFASGSGSRVDVREPASYAVVTFTATVTETLEDAATLGLRDRDTNRAARVWVTDDFLVRMKNNTTTTTAQTLRLNDTVLVKAYRDLDGNLIAQTIRLRNR